MLKIFWNKLSFKMKLKLKISNKYFTWNEKKVRNNQPLGVRGHSSVRGMEMLTIGWGHLYCCFPLLALKLMQVFSCFPDRLVLESRFVFCWQPSFLCSLRGNLKLIMLPLHPCLQLDYEGKGLRDLRVRNSHTNDSTFLWIPLSICLS